MSSKSGNIHQVRHEIVDAASVDQRIDNYLVKMLKGVPKTRIYRMLRKGEVRVDGGRVKPTHRLRMGQSVRIPPVSTAARQAASPPPGYVDALEASVIAETDLYLALNKPSGIAVHGGSGVQLGLIETLRAHRGGFLELVHRLDRDTSGVLLLAKKRESLRALHAAFRERATAKRYRLVVHGRWDFKHKSVRHRLAKHVVGSGERRVRVQLDGQAAHTDFEPLVVGANVSTLQAQLHTGRTHQARVHALAEGHPIVGDEKYLPSGLREHRANEQAGRLLLHAEALRFVLEGQRVKLTAPVPSIFDEVQRSDAG